MRIDANSRTHRSLYLIIFTPLIIALGFYALLFFTHGGPSIRFDAMIHNDNKVPITALLVWDSSNMPPVWVTIDGEGSKLVEGVFEGESEEECYSRNLFVFSWKLDESTADLRFRLSGSSFLGMQSYKGIDVYKQYHIFIDARSGSETGAP